MICKTLALVVLLACSVWGQAAPENGTLGSCKNPKVEQRLMADDVRFASPFYVIALPRTPRTELIDNVCYTYYENEEKNNGFFHVMSIVYKNESNSYYKLAKQDILDRTGLAEAKGEAQSDCTYHDYTLVPICNVTVFILYRCYIDGECTEADIGRTKDVDVRVVLAASTSISDECKKELDANLKDTSVLSGGDYVILPQAHKPKCITTFGKRTSINPNNTLGSTSVTEDTNILNRLGDDEDFPPLGAAPHNAQYTPITSVSKKTYAQAVKGPKLTETQGMNVVHYSKKGDHEDSDECGCS